jgi:hypothetical protein
MTDISAVRAFSDVCESNGAVIAAGIASLLDIYDKCAPAMQSLEDKLLLIDALQNVLAALPVTQVSMATPVTRHSHCVQLAEALQRLNAASINALKVLVTLDKISFMPCNM